MAFSLINITVRISNLSHFHWPFEEAVGEVVFDVGPAVVTIYEGNFALDCDVVAWVGLPVAFVAGASG